MDAELLSTFRAAMLPTQRATTAATIMGALLKKVDFESLQNAEAIEALAVVAVGITDTLMERLTF